MFKNDLIAAIAHRNGLHQNVVRNVLETLSDVAWERLENGEDITIPRIVKVFPRMRAARNGHIPSTMEKIKIPEKMVVVAKPVKALADHIG